MAENDKVYIFLFIDLTRFFCRKLILHWYNTTNFYYYFFFCMSFYFYNYHQHYSFRNFHIWFSFKLPKKEISFQFLNFFNTQSMRKNNFEKKGKKRKIGFNGIGWRILLFVTENWIFFILKSSKIGIFEFKRKIAAKWPTNLLIFDFLFVEKDFLL